MARRRGKSSSKQDDSWLPALETPTGQSARGYNEYVVLGGLLLIMLVGGSWFGWVCSDHQQTIDSLSETLASMQARVTKLQQQLGTDNAQLTSMGGIEERLAALEEGYANAQRQVELALATSEQIKSKDLQSKLWSLQTDMNDKLAELQQNTISIAALNTIIKNKSIELEVVKQSVNTMLSASTELAIQISGFSSMLSVTKLRLDEQSSVVDGLMSQLDGQKSEISEIKESFDSNRESLASNTMELLDIKELLESEQIKRTQSLEKKLRSLYKRLEDHQTKTESLHFHLTSQMEALQNQFLSGDHLPSRPEAQVQDDEQITVSDNKEGETLEITEKDLAEVEEIRDDDGTKAEDEFIIEQQLVEIEPSERPIEEPVHEIQSPSEELGREFEDEKAVDTTEEIEALQEEHMVTDDIEETDVDEIQTALEDSEHVIDETSEIAEEKVEVHVGEEIKIHSEKTSETEKQIDVSDVEELQIPLEDSNSATAETEHAAVEKEVELTTAQETQTDSEGTDGLSNLIDEVNSEEDDSGERSAAEIKTQQDDNADQEAGTDAKDIQIPSDETDIHTNGNVDNPVRDILDEIEHEAVKDLTTASGEESVVTEKSVKV